MTKILSKRSRDFLTLCLALALGATLLAACGAAATANPPAEPEPAASAAQPEPDEAPEPEPEAQVDATKPEPEPVEPAQAEPEPALQPSTDGLADAPALTETEPEPEPATKKPPKKVARGDAEAGAGVFKKCQGCHGSVDKPGKAPDLFALGWSKSERTSAAETIRDGRGKMPAFGGKLSEQEILDVVAYLAATKRN